MVMKKIITKFPEHYLFYNDDIKIVGTETLNQSPILNVNINSSMFDGLESELENIYHTLKDLPDVPSVQHPLHMYETLDGKTNTLKEDVESALTRIREASDSLRSVCLDYYFDKDNQRKLN
jgi:DNA repair ATPase RecN